MAKPKLTVKFAAQKVNGYVYPGTNF